MAKAGSDFWDQFFLSLGMQEEEDEMKVVEAMAQRQTPPIRSHYLEEAARAPKDALHQPMPHYAPLPREKYVEPRFEYLEPVAEIKRLRGPEPGQPENLYSHKFRRR